jgi:hypothetical protein
MNSPLPFVPRGAKARGMARHHSPRHPLFRQRWFADDIIITSVRWYLRFKLSYRELAELARELGVIVAPSTVLRWGVRYVPEFEKCWQAYERPVGDSWRVDETYLKVGGRFWCKVLKGSVSCDDCRDDGTDFGTRSFQGTAL